MSIHSSLFYMLLMILKVTEEELRQLIAFRVILQVNPESYRACLCVPDLEHEPVYVDIDIEAADEEIEDRISTILHTKQEIKEGFEKFWNAYPTTDSHGNYKMTANMRNVSKKVAFDLYKQAINRDGISPKDIVTVVLYEVDWRKNASTGNSNELHYMPRMRNYLMRDGYIRAQYKAFCEDSQYSVNDEGELVNNSNGGSDRTAVLL